MKTIMQRFKVIFACELAVSVQYQIVETTEI